jgi:acetyltransferase
MTTRNLDKMLAPSSVVLVGASQKRQSVGATIAQNLVAGGFAGSLYFVNPKYKEVCGVKCYSRIEELPSAPDLAIIATPPSTVAGLVSELAIKGTRAVNIITAGMVEHKQALLDVARPYCLRLLGPNSLGLMLPRLKLNASFAHRAAPAGDLAFVSQSGALITAVIDWAAPRHIGFSHVISVGDMVDADFGDLLDYLAGDTQSRAILLYMEAVTNAPKFISAARRAARVKPVVVVKSGRHDAGARAAMSHTGAMAGSDAAYDAAFRRTGLLRVKTLPELFSAAEMLARHPHISGERLMILTNGGGAGVLAADELQDQDGTLATLSAGVISRLNQSMPATWSRANPVDIIGDASPDRYRAALSQLLRDKSSDAILVMQCPTALASSTEVANVVVDMVRTRGNGVTPRKPVLTCWLGDEAAHQARHTFADHGIPSFETPSDAVSGFMQLVHHARAQAELMQTPDHAVPAEQTSGLEIANIIGKALASGRTALTAVEAKSVFSAAGVPVADARVASNATEVHQLAEAILKTNAACVVKLMSRDISHKSDVGGVRLGLESPDAAERAAREMQATVKSLRPEAQIDGFSVEAMIRRPGAQEIIIGMSEDPTFGPILLVGAGGTAVEVIGDCALGLPPIDDVLGRQMIMSTRVAKLLNGYRDRPAANVDALVKVLMRVSDLIITHPEIRELDINPLLVDENGVIALDARMRIEAPALHPRRPLAIRPYPTLWHKTIEIPAAGSVQLRPVRPNDEDRFETFFSKITPGDIRLRFFMPKVELSHRFLARLTQIDYAREMAFVAISKETDELLGVVRLVLNPDLQQGEFGILVRSDLQGNGLGWHLMRHMINYAQHEGVQHIAGTVLAENTTMIGMAKRLGFKINSDKDDQTVLEVTLSTATAQPNAPANFPS